MNKVAYSICIAFLSLLILSGCSNIDVPSYLNGYEEHYKDDMLKSDIKDVPKGINETIIKILRREKMEEAYKFWIMKLQRKYTIKINETQLEKITGS